MDNPDNMNLGINPLSDIQLFSPNKCIKQHNQLLDTQSPYQSKVSLYNTPNKIYDQKTFFPSFVNTPTNANYNMFFPISPLNNEQKNEIPFQNSQINQKNCSSIFKSFGSPFCTEKKNEMKNLNNRNEYYPGIKGINLNDKFNDVEMKNINEKNFYENNLLDNNNNKYEFINNICNKDEMTFEQDKKNEKRKKRNYSNKKAKNFLFGDDSFSKNNVKDNILEQKNNNNIDDKISTIIVEESIFDDIKNIFGENLSKKEYIFNSLNSSIISNFSLGQNDSSFYSQSLQGRNAQPYFPPQILSGNKKNSNNWEYPPTHIPLSTNNSSTLNKCTCKNSNCFKLYCECFANGKYCDNCSCVNCKNTIENKDLRNQKYEEIISRNPKALQKINSTKRSWTCKCKNSNCSKKYCDCLQNGRCCTSKCKCINCFNKNTSFNNRNIGNEKKNIARRIRGIKNKIINKRNNGDENENNTIEEEKEINKETKKKMTNLTTPKKNKNYFDDDEIYIYYDKNEKSTAAMTNKRNKRKMLETRTETKNKNIYTKLQMDNI